MLSEDEISKLRLAKKRRLQEKLYAMEGEVTQWCPGLRFDLDTYHEGNSPFLSIQVSLCEKETPDARWRAVSYIHVDQSGMVEKTETLDAYGGRKMNQLLICVLARLLCGDFTFLGDETEWVVKKRSLDVMSVNDITTHNFGKIFDQIIVPKDGKAFFSIELNRENERLAREHMSKILKEGLQCAWRTRPEDVIAPRQENAAPLPDGVEAKPARRRGDRTRGRSQAKDKRRSKKALSKKLRRRRRV